MFGSQRIAIARALLRDPRILILDEATSALDQLSENHVQQALKNIREKKKVTTVTIAHRLTTIIDSDVIAVINQGSIAELGDHMTLLNKETGIYRSLCETQGITTSNSGTSIGSDPKASPESDSETVPTNSEKTRADLFELENGTNDKVDLADVDEEDIIEVVPETRMSKIWKFLGRDTMYAVIGIIGSAGVGALSPCESILTAQIVTNFYIVPVDDMLHVNLKIIYQFLYFALGSLVANLMVGIGLSRSGSNLGKKLRTVAFSSMLERSIGWYDDAEHTTGELTTMLSADVEAVESLAGLPLGFRVRVLSSIVTGVVVSLVYSLKIGLVAIACVPIIMSAELKVLLHIIHILSLDLKIIINLHYIPPDINQNFIC
jgi:ATP-binding cassette subfamily B (MDR/TAP) protein 1